WIGVFAPGSSNVSLGCMPVSIGAGQTMNVAIGGDGFVSGKTPFDIPKASFRRVSDFSYAGNYVYATFNVSPTASPSSLVLLVKNGNDSAALTGPLGVVSQVRTRVAHRYRILSVDVRRPALIWLWLLAI